MLSQQLPRTQLLTGIREIVDNQDAITSKRCREKRHLSLGQDEERSFVGGRLAGLWLRIWVLRSEPAASVRLGASDMNCCCFLQVMKYYEKKGNDSEKRWCLLLLVQTSLGLLEPAGELTVNNRDPDGTV